VHSVNGVRRHQTKSALVATAAELVPALEAERAARMAAGQKEGGRGHKKTLGNELPKVSPDDNKAVAQAAKLVTWRAATMGPHSYRQK